ncbi:MAG: acyltransferase [Lachnospiraceae bacterium]|nr:acyltransferase [Lachnospiraceae bacterium]
MKTRTWYSFNLMRFVFSIIVVLFHLHVLKGGYLGVEFFFFISGAFLYKKVADTDNPFNLSQYLKSRYIKFLPYTTITIFGTALLIIVYNKFPLSDTIRLLERAFLESTLLGGFGIVGQSFTASTGFTVDVLIDGHLWFVFSLLLMIPFAAAFFKLKDKIYLLAISLMLYGFLEVKFGCISDFASYEWTWIKPSMRTLAGLLLGGYLMYLKDSLVFIGTEVKRRVISYLSLVVSILLIIFDNYNTISYTMSEYLWILLIAVYIVFQLSTTEGKLFENKSVQKICNNLGKITLGIYCYHPLVLGIIGVYFPTPNMILYSVETIVFSIMLTILTILSVNCIGSMYSKAKLLD